MNTISLDNISVQVKNDKIKIFKDDSNEEIVPKLCNAHAFFQKSMPIYHFLCDLQYQNVIGNPSLHIPVIEDKVTFIPRIIYNSKIILAPASWHFSKTDLISLKHMVADNIIDYFSKRWKVPRAFNIIDGESELFIDLDDSESVAILLSYVRSSSRLKLEECLFDRHNSFVNSNNNTRFNNEVIFCFYNDKFKEESTSISPLTTQNVIRHFFPGTEWVYFKIYINSEDSDQYLMDCLSTIIEPFIAYGKVLSYFFIRYKDPHYHIRIRIKLADTSYYQDLVTSFSSFTSENFEKAVWKFQLETYEREIERYGASTIGYAEQIFFYDSNLVTHLTQVRLWEPLIMQPLMLISF